MGLHDEASLISTEIVDRCTPYRSRGRSDSACKYLWRLFDREDVLCSLNTADPPRFCGSAIFGNR